MTKAKTPIILMAEDDDDDRLLAQDAFSECDFPNHLLFVEDGVELMNYLYRRDKYADPKQSPRPHLILLDLNMPRKDGREALAEIKADDSLRRIPVVVLTTSKADEDVQRSYDLGIAGYITKPGSFEGLVETIKMLGKYWLESVKLPG